ncbi:nitrogenase component I subunit alpha [Desulfofundulus thermobenzoicus]|uniref:Nitrogenase protein alpha chain n=1 Tax=Desulfofundulus thermobenzoicus TaxID=29376 RepID=A0A6N7IS56_9FIRM|nr:nitrogenase component I subunit alpha [Desulfofundulus thermobenzoicus]MQL52904.1 nitrogenase component I subunit alpha [Desulfofundulus thermobenzoicus]
MPMVKMKCDELIPERDKHIYITEEGKSIIPSCNIATLPGDMTERGCAFAGARGVIGGPISDIIAMVHAPVGCAWYTWGTRRHLSDLYPWALPGRLTNVAFNRRYCVVTDMQEKDVVFGGMKKLERACLEAIRLFPEAKGLIIFTTCTTGLIGDDVQAVARQIEKKTGLPVFTAESPGCSGVSQSKGHHDFNTQFYRQVKALRERRPELKMREEEKTPYDICLIGDYNMDWDLKVIKPLFEKIGVRIVAVFSGNERIENLIKMPDVKLNVVHCQRSAEYIAEMEKDGYDIPFIRCSLFGIHQTSKALRETAAFFGLQERAEKVIAEELARVEKSLAFYREKLQGKRVAIYVGGPRVWHWIKLMEELGMTVVAGACTFAHEDDYEKINARAKAGMLVIDAPNEFEIEEMLLETKPDLFLTGLKEKYLGRKMGIPTVNSHSYEKGPYAGFIGMINFARDIYQGIYAPVWKFQWGIKGMTGGEENAAE